jgi:polyhydroxyalkanoate synthesis regulator phasin
MEKKLDIEISKREFIEKEILELKSRVRVLQDRIEEIENRLKGFA